MVAQFAPLTDMFHSEPWVDLEAVDRQANDLLTKFGVTQEPVDPVAIASSLGYRVRAVAFPDPDLAGQVSNRSGEIVIDVSGFDSRVRQRFTIAHEIGHAQLHLAGRQTAFVDLAGTLNRATNNALDKAVDRKELAANRFGAALLMPAEWVKRAVAQHQTLDQLASRFGVSRSAMRHRLNSLGLVPQI
ncbi:MAG TPA: ImmA/IrrE family metallo-endopeptidase [Candidatus Elarobacter sp.]|jgi:predicted transcriptional regulator|nr:ImmA/IrrE family metallo-endopeptidase [Candidatus Elarobacter sp.]